MPLPSTVDSPRLGVLYSSAVGLTLTNPMTIMAFAAIFAGAGLVAQAGTGSALVVTIGVALRLAGVVAGAVDRGVGGAAHRQRQGDGHRESVSGGVLMLFGGLALVAGVRGLG